MSFLSRLIGTSLWYYRWYYNATLFEGAVFDIGAHCSRMHYYPDCSLAFIGRGFTNGLSQPPHS